MFVEHDGFLPPRSPLRVETVAAGGRPVPAPHAGAADASRPAAARSTACACSTSPRSGPVPPPPTCSPRSGADVVKVESPTRPDGMRFATTRPPTDPQWVEYSPTFHGTNPGKRSVAIDFSTPAGRDLVLRLVERCRRRRRELHAAGDAERRSRLRRAGAPDGPTSSCCACPRSALDGPWRDHSGFAQTTEQVSGIAWLTGTAEIEPLGALDRRPDRGHPRRDSRCSPRSTHRRRTGAGSSIEMPMAEVALNVAAEPIVTWSAYGMLLERHGNRGPQRRAAGRLRVPRATSNGWRCRSCPTTSGARLVQVLGEPAWAASPDAGDRRRPAGAPRRHRPRARRVVRRARPRRRRHRCCSPPACMPPPVWDQNLQDELPQLAARGFTQWLDHPLAGSVGQPGTGLPRVGSSTCATGHRRPPSASTPPRCSARSSGSARPRSPSSPRGA